MHMKGRSRQRILCARAEACSCSGAEFLKILQNARANYATDTLKYQFYGSKTGKLSYQIHMM